MKKGWFIGNFEPSMLKTSSFEVGFKLHEAGEKYGFHYHEKVTEFNLIVENDGCGNYLQEVIDKYSGSYYYAPLSIKSDPIMGVYVDGAYNLDGFKSTGNVNCIISIKCGCGGKTEKVQINPNSSYSAIVSALNDTGIINIQ